MNSIAIINQGAVKDAENEDASLKAGREHGALFCVPILVKDNIDTICFPTSAGSKALLDNFPHRWHDFLPCQRGAPIRYWHFSKETSDRL